MNAREARKHAAKTFPTTSETATSHVMLREVASRLEFLQRLGRIVNRIDAIYNRQLREHRALVEQGESHSTPRWRALEMAMSRRNSMQRNAIQMLIWYASERTEAESGRQAPVVRFYSGWWEDMSLRARRR